MRENMQFSPFETKWPHSTHFKSIFLKFVISFFFRDEQHSTLYVLDFNQPFHYFLLLLLCDFGESSFILPLVFDEQTPTIHLRFASSWTQAI